MPEPAITFFLMAYGLPFFILWIIIAILTKKDSTFTLSKTVWLIAGFGLTHGIHEWTEFLDFRYMLHFDPLDALSLVISYYFLIQFGISTLVIAFNRNKFLHVLSLAPVLLWFLLVIRQPEGFMTSAIGDVYARYSLGLLGCFLTAYVLFMQRTEFRKTGRPDFTRSLYMTSGGFLFYGLLSGLVVPQASLFPASVLNYTTFYEFIGLPVQAFRTVAIIFIGYIMNRLLRIFEWERMHTVMSAKEELERTVAERTAESAKTNRKLRLMIETEPECVKVLSADGSVLQMNRAGLNMIEAESEAQALGMKLDELIDPNHREAFQDLTERVFRGESGILEFELTGLKGSRVWLETHAAPLRNEKSEIIALLGITRDITARKKAEEKVRQSEAKYRNLFESSMDGVFVLDLDGNFIDVNRTAYARLGYTKEEMLALHISKLDPLDFAERVPERLKQIREQGFAVFESAHLRKDGTVMPVEINARLLEYEGRQVYLSVIRDITGRKKVEQELRELNRNFVIFLENTTDFVFFKDSESRFRFCSQTLANITGHANWRDLIGKHDLEVFPEDVARIYYEEEAPVFRNGVPLLNKTDPYYDAQGRRGWVSTSKWPVFDENNKVIGIFGISRDITESKKMEEEIRHLAQHDALTGLPNRSLLSEILKVETAQARRNRKKLAMLFLDLDRFKEINDTLGHDAGDQLLKEASHRIAKNIRESDTLARIGGDEFNILLTDLSNDEDVSEVAQKIVTSFQTPFRIAGQELHITTSIGISIYPDDSTSIGTLLRYSDIAMYYAKERGRNNFQFYNPEINSRSVERMKLENMLRQTIRRREIEVYYQPQVNINTREIIGAEALARWKHPQRGILEPKEFIPAAEDTGFIAAIDEYVLRTACLQIRSWLDAGLRPVRITVNLSAREFQNPDLVEKIAEIFRETGAPPRYLMIEITESLAMSNIERTIKRLNELVEMGVLVAIDDFGTGYSSLNYLKRLPVENLKIDKSFIRDIATDPDDRTIINAVTAMAHMMKLKVTAEGVETEDQLAFVKDSKCDEAQGYLFSSPVPADQFEELIGSGK